MGTNDAGGAGEVPPELALALRRFLSASERIQRACLKASCYRRVRIRFAGKVENSCPAPIFMGLLAEDHRAPGRPASLIAPSQPKITHLRPHPLRHIAVEAIVNIEEYKRVLLAKEKELVRRIDLALNVGREQTDEGAIERGDKSVTDLDEGVDFNEADVDTHLLKEVRDALQRIENGTFGKCIVDGLPINEKRLKAIPWAPYCLKHEQELEKSRSAPPATL